MSNSYSRTFGVLLTAAAALCGSKAIAADDAATAPSQQSPVQALVTAGGSGVARLDFKDMATCVAVAKQLDNTGHIYEIDCIDAPNRTMKSVRHGSVINTYRIDIP